MTTREKIFSIAMLLCIAPPVIGRADPLPRTVGISLFAVPLLLALEGLLITVLARHSSVYRRRFVPFWIVVSTLTLALVVFIIVQLSGPIGSTAAVITAEAVAVVLEALCISVALGKPTFARNPRAAPGFRRALAYSLIVNLVSFGGGLLAVPLA